MTRPKHAPGESVRDFVVETRVKPDGRQIHYYEWPEPEPDRLPAARHETRPRDARDPAPTETGRV